MWTKTYDTDDMQEEIEFNTDLTLAQDFEHRRTCWKENRLHCTLSLVTWILDLTEAKPSPNQ